MKILRKEVEIMVSFEQYVDRWYRYAIISREEVRIAAGKQNGTLDQWGEAMGKIKDRAYRV